MNVRRPEDDPAYGHEKESHSHLQHLVRTGPRPARGDHVGVFAVSPEEYERQEKGGMVGSPSDEGPVGTVPQAAQKEDGERVADNEATAHPTAAKRYVDVIAKPSVQRNMPTPPELGYIARKIGQVEVFHQPDAEQFRRTHCDV